MLDAETLEAARSGDIHTLVRLDERGLLLGADESTTEYADRLECLCKNTASMDEALTESGQYDVEDVTVADRDRIPRELFEQPGVATRELFGFRMDWVPGFFINPRFSWLFGGCAYYFFPDFFALFIVRRSFANRERWLIYSRDELLSHELCHVARIGFESEKYEEFLAYKTSSSAFRRVLGGVFRNASDSLVLLACTGLLMLGQILRSTVLTQLWAWPFWVPLGAHLALLGTRLRAITAAYSAASTNLSSLTTDRPEPVLFRCTDAEIEELARLEDAAALEVWVLRRTSVSPRWRVIAKRFLAPRRAAADQAESSSSMVPPVP